MLQQTQVKAVIPYYERWLRELPTLATLASAPSEQIHKLWEGLGYYTRVRNLQKAARQIVSQHDGNLPQHFDDVLALPGVGRYTAGAICSIAFNQPAPILDGNVIRVLTRLNAIAENPREKTTNTRLWQLAVSLVETAAAIPHSAFCIPHSSGPCSALNQSLMELGALICTPRQPRCDACPVRAHCRARREDRMEEFPHLARRAPATARRFLTLVIHCGGKYLARQRPAGSVNAHLWEFPNWEINGDPATALATATQFLGARPRACEPLGEIKHTITRYRITQRVFRLAMKTPVPAAPAGARWLPLARLRQLPFTSAHGKILRQLSIPKD